MKEKEFKFYVINLPIKGNKKDNIELYSEFFEYIFKRKKPVDIGREKAAIIRTFNKVDEKNKIYYGYITSFTKVGENWFNIETMDKQEYSIPKHLFANPKESYYFFLPKFHRLVIMKSTGGITLANCMKFFLGLKKAISKKYDFDPHYEVSKDAIEKIINADIVKSITMKFSYSNADIGDDAFDFVDNDLKRSNTDSIRITAQSHSANGINIQESQILSGGLGLSQSYGETQAVISNNGRQETVRTENYPLIIRMQASLGDFQNFYNKVYDRIKTYLRR